MAPGSSGAWENPLLLRELNMAFYTATQEAGVLTPTVQQAIQKHLNDRGHSQSWEAVRYQLAVAMKWTAKIHEDLLISVFQVTKFNGEQVRAILADMHAGGYDITDRALTQHIQKLKKSRENTNGHPSTPKKATKAGGTARTASGRKKTKKMAKCSDEEEDIQPKDEASDDDDDMGASPMAKRAKTQEYTHFNDAVFAPM